MPYGSDSGVRPCRATGDRNACPKCEQVRSQTPGNWDWVHRAGGPAHWRARSGAGFSKTRRSGWSCWGGKWASQWRSSSSASKRVIRAGVSDSRFGKAADVGFVGTVRASHRGESRDPVAIQPDVRPEVDPTKIEAEGFALIIRGKLKLPPKPLRDVKRTVGGHGEVRGALTAEYCVLGIDL